MIQHTVAFRLVHPADSAEEAEFLGTARATLTGVPGVRDFTVSRQVSPKSPLTFQFSMVFDDDAAYAAYDAHPTTAASSPSDGSPRSRSSRSSTSSL